MPSGEGAKRRSSVALDAVAFFLSDVETGVGPFMAGYFTAVRHWNPEQIGIALAAQKIASVAGQVTAGWLIDHSTSKKWLMAGAALAISLGCVLVVRAEGVWQQAMNQVFVGVSTSAATLLLPALALGIVGREALGKRLGRNGAWSHAGNMVTASLAGYLGYRAGQQWIFYISAILGVCCTAAALAIRGRDIDDRVAREGPESGEERPTSVREMLRDPVVFSFALAVLLFHVANSALLPLAGEELSQTVGKSASLLITLCIVLPQVIMIPVSLGSGWAAGRWGRKPVFLCAFGALIARGLLFGFSRDPRYVVGVELLDGIGTGIAGVVTVLVVSDLAKGTGRFNALGGMMQGALSVGAFLGNLAAGSAAKRFGFSPVFLGLAGIALLGMLFFALRMPETGEGQKEAAHAV